MLPLGFRRKAGARIEWKVRLDKRLERGNARKDRLAHGIDLFSRVDMVTHL